MKNKITLTIALFTAGLSFAQVGVNTPNPRATLDVTAKVPTGTARTPEGLIIPNIDRQRAQSMTGIATSTMIYVNSVATGTQAGIAANINAVGYYYFNGTVWVKLVPDVPAFVDTDTNIYSNNGTLSSNRTVSQAGNTLAFTSTATAGTSHFTVDGSTFNVDARNNRIGIGTNTPNNLLDLGGSTGKKLAVWNSTAGDDFYGFGAAANVLQIYAGADNTQAPLMTLNQNGRVGIGTTNPQTDFHTIGTRRFENATAGSVTVGSVLTAMDSNGTAEWKTPRTETILGNLGGGYDLPFAKNAEMRYTGSSITLPPGKWLVNVTLLVHPVGTFSATDWMFVRSTFSTDNLTTIGQVGTGSSDVIRPTLMSFQIAGPYSGGQKLNVATGSIQINNNSGSNKTYRYVVGSTEASGTVTGASLKGVGGGWAENSIVATAIN
ncbi:hypothetical protein [Chryseobacterium daeguense]|uniref:hypothetical protein n=1 Tax=Chryseobacterium daeguense TaxID=412438 RepID=UPI000408387B|nr:hypothetical protein [Chryseobacterium daeguense]